MLSYALLLIVLALSGDNNKSPDPIAIRFTLLISLYHNITSTDKEIDQVRKMATESPELAKKCDKLIADLQQQKIQMGRAFNVQLSKISTDVRRRLLRCLP
jgi:hypothetical protein